MRNHLEFILFLFYFWFTLTSTSSSFPSLSNLSDLSQNSSAKPCSPIIEQLFINQDFSCVDGCVVLNNLESLTLTSLILSDISSTIITCIQFNNIQKIEIDTLTLSNLVVQVDNPSNYFLYFSNINSLSISKLSISNIGQQNNSIAQTAIFIDDSVISLTLQTMYFSSENSYPNNVPSIRAQGFQFLIQSNAQIIIVSTLQINNCYDYMILNSFQTLEIDKVIWNQALLSNQPYPYQRPTLELRACLSLTVNSIEILDKRDPHQQQIRVDITIKGVIRNEIQTKIQIGAIIRDSSSINNQIIQLAQTRFQIWLSTAYYTDQSLQPNLVINSISASQSLINSGGSSNQPDSSLSISFNSFKRIRIDSIVQSNTSSSLNFDSIDQVSIGTLIVAGINNNQQNSFIVDTFLISTLNSIQVFSFDNIIIQNTVFSSTSVIQGFANTLILKKILIENSVLINSQFLKIYLTSAVISNIQIIDSVLRTPISSEQSSPIFLFMLSESVVFNNFEMKSQNLNIPWIESLPSEGLTQSQAVIVTNNCNSFSFSGIHVDFSGQPLGFFSLIGLQKQLVLTNSTFESCYASLGGGCFEFILKSDDLTMDEPQVFLSNVTFTRASSGYFGGAIFGSEIVSAIDVHFESCSSMIGGALYLRQNHGSIPQALANITFTNNIADIVNPNICYGVNKIQKGQVWEYNPNLKGTPLFLNPLGQYIKSQMIFYYGILYIYELQLLIDGLWYSSLPISRTVQNKLNQQLFSQGNLFPFMTINNPLSNSILVNVTTFYVFYEPNYYYQNNLRNTEVEFIFSPINRNIIIFDPPTGSKCKDGMEQIIKFNSQSNYCEYCGLQSAINPPSKVCQTCDTSYFETCYANQTNLNQGFWRSINTMNTTLIEICSISKLSCNGGFGIGDSLCYEGNIGPQCLNCDIYGEYWGESYSMSSDFSCNKCSDIHINDIKIILGLVLILLSLFVIMKGNFNATKNYIYADYLAKIKMIYIGSSLSRMQQMSTCLKVLLFNIFFSNIVSSFTKLHLLRSISQASIILNSPLDTEFFSLDCFLVNIFSSDLNLGFANLLISIATPGIIFAVHLILGVLVFYLSSFKQNKIKQETVVNSLILSLTYLYVIVFYPFIFSLCLKSLFCIRLDGTKTYSLIDLSLECGDQFNTSLNLIHALAAPVLFVIVIFTPLAILALLYYKKQKLRTVKMMFTLGFLYREYKNQFYLWEFVRMILKQMCVFLQVSLIDNSQLYGTIISLLLTLYLVLLILKQPFEGILFNRLEQISVLIQILSIQSAVLYSQQQLNQIQNGTIIQCLFIGSQILNVIFIGCMTVFIIYSFFQKKLIKLHRKWKIPYAEHFLPLYSKQLRNNMKRLRNLVYKFKGKVNRVDIDEISMLLFADDTQNRAAEVELEGDFLACKMEKSSFQQKSDTNESIISQPLLINH